MKEVIVIQGQTVEDICIQEYGSIEMLISMLEDNDLGMDSILVPGEVILIQEDPALIDYQVVRYLQQQGIKPNAGIVEEPDTMYVEVDYVDEDYVL